MKPYVIALEEHYTDPAVMAHGPETGMRAVAVLQERLTDLGHLRLAEMDAAGIDLQVISHAPSPLQQLEPQTAVELATLVNDRLHDAVDRNPERFAAF
ncbi:MAG TPA: amidohydrolase, partial [Chloroflexota bacterium]|nr:amidohydrolase [Chloroflexota bacterium]